MRATAPTSGSNCPYRLSSFLGDTHRRLIFGCDGAGMNHDEQAELRNAVLARNAARRRLRRATGAAVAIAVGLSGVFAALAAGSTHSKKTIVRASTARSARPLAALTAAPAAPLVAVNVEPPASVSPSASAPTSSYQPPVVSSGGS